MKTFALRLVLLAITLCSKSVMAITIIGNSTGPGGQFHFVAMDATDGFTMDLNPSFVSVVLEKENRVMLGTFIQNSMFGGPKLLAEIQKLSEFYPEFKNISRTDFEKFFTADPTISWQRIAIAIAECAVGFIGKNATTISAIVSWGGGKGLIFAAPIHPQMEMAILKSVESLSVDPGACAWP